MVVVVVVVFRAGRMMDIDCGDGGGGGFWYGGGCDRECGVGDAGRSWRVWIFRVIVSLYRDLIEDGLKMYCSNGRCGIDFNDLYTRLDM